MSKVASVITAENIIINAPRVLIAQGVLTLDLNKGNLFHVPLTDDVNTMLIANKASVGNLLNSLQLVTIGDGTQRAITWPVTTLWAGGTPPTPSDGAGVIDFYQLESFDGVTWFGFVLGQAFA